MRRRTLLICLLIFGLAGPMRADDAKFNLPGPRIDVYVTRGGVTLPIAQVPNLMPQDKLRVKMDLPATQLNHLLLVLVFLRSSTNEPPDNWFTKIETWKAQPPEGTTVTVPNGAQRAMLFVAPETGGDFTTLRSAVKGNPGTFLLAAASLDKASSDARRIAQYMAGMQRVTLSDPAVILARSTDLAATLSLKPNADCFKQPVTDQVDCLTTASTPLLLDDGHAQSMGDAISSGAQSAFINEASTAPNGGVYSAYVGTLVDLMHMAEMLRTAQYKYIPAISSPKGATLNLMLNTAPSFNNPKSVIVVGLPAIQSVRLPQFTLPDPTQMFCLQNPELSIPLRGAPLFFSTAFAHDLVLDFEEVLPSNQIHLIADADAGGLLRDGEAPQPLRLTRQDNEDSSLPNTVRVVLGTVHGYWGFDRFEGPALRFQRTAGGPWTLIGADALDTGKDAPVTLQGNSMACIDHILLQDENGGTRPITFGLSAVRSGLPLLPLNLPLKENGPGTYAVVIQEKGIMEPIRLAFTLSGEHTRLDKMLRRPTGHTAQLIGQGLENVTMVHSGGQVFLPAAPPDHGELELRSSGTYQSSGETDAAVTLKDGRTVHVAIALEDPATILQVGRLTATPAVAAGELAVTLDSSSDIPLNGTLHFVVQSQGVFPHTQTIELATADGAARTSLSLTNGLILQDDHTAVAGVDLLKVFGESAYGELHVRSVSADGASGDWITLGNLVRRPHITSIQCAKLREITCRIEGKDLFLALAFSTTKSFEQATLVPSGFDDPVLSIPMNAMPRNRQLYVKLRDGSNAIATVQLDGSGSRR